MNITIIGTGYVGLVTGACFSEIGHSVTCYDIDKSKIQNLKKGKVPFFEPNLKDFVNKNIISKNLSFSSSINTALKNRFIFICVDTPDDGKGKPNLTNLNNVIDAIASKLSQDSIIIFKSTVPVGTNKIMQNRLRDKVNGKFNIDVISNPEFLREGSAINDFMRPDRIIIGADNPKSSRKLANLYKPLSRKMDKMFFTSLNSAELIKYASNSFLATKISFINEIAEIAESFDADINDIRLGMGLDQRIGKDFLYAGLGYGGSCFPKDINALINAQKISKSTSLIVDATKKRNTLALANFEKKILKHCKGNKKKKSLTIWGLSFKPNTDDIRESLAVKLIIKLHKKFCNIYCYDPEAGKNVKYFFRNYQNIKIISNPYQNISNSNALVICTEWKEFWNPNYEKLSMLKDNLIFDGRNILDKDDLKKYKLNYYGVGTKSVES
jgi:UDPglucose 6-dehydrogenase